MIVATAADVANDINDRFQFGGSTGNLSQSGVVVHQWDDLQSKYNPWEPCTNQTSDWCPFNDRVSASIINSALPLVKGSIGIFSGVAGGVVVRSTSSATSQLLCSFQGDGGTMTRVGHGCGCQQTEQQPCNNSCAAPNAGSHQCAWDPEQIADMLNACNYPAYLYNEVVMDGPSWMSNLPSTIEAFFIPSKADDASKSFTVQAHSKFLKVYKLTDVNVPLLSLDVSASPRPFAIVPTANTLI